MLPIFFHVEAHLWIIYILLVNGLIVHWLLSDYSQGYASLTKPLEAQVLAAFFISLLINGCLLLLLSLVSLKFALLKIALPVITGALILLSFRQLSWHRFKALAVGNCNIWRLSVYAFVFIILFYNGGLIEQTSDAWWHMSLANKIGLASSFFLEQGHLNGFSERYYPPLWHGNLALINTLSDIGLPIIWNAFTAWGGVFKVMGFYLMAFSLSRSVAIGTMSALLFILLPGVGNSYLRVSAWPSHIAYIGFFCSFYVGFYLFDSVQQNKVRGAFSSTKALFRQPATFISLCCLMLILTFTHLAELLWFVLGIFFYLTGLLIYRAFSDRQIETASGLWRPLSGVLIVSFLIACGWFAFVRKEFGAMATDTQLAYLLPIFFLVSLLLCQFTRLNNIHFSKLSFPQWLLMAIGVMLLLSVDARQLLSLFNPELAYPRAAYPQYPLVAQGWFGGELKIPGWHLQLRSGLLYSGIVAVPLSILIAIVKPSRLTLFLATTASFALLFCLSPYLFHWLRDILSYHSAWRISILIFHPIILAAALVYCWQILYESNS